jgi:hypothetical protein
MFATAMWTRWAMLAVVALSLIESVSAHAFMSYPATRGALSGSGGIFHYDPVDMSCPVDYCPECQNAAFLQKNHGDMWFAPYAPMDRTEPFRTGFGLCGDSGLDGRDPMTQPHMKAGAFSVGCEGKPTAVNLAPGQVINIQVQSVAHHQGFLEFFLCDTSACGGDITPKCFESNQCVQLIRAPHPSCESGEDTECAPIDPHFPGRWYMACHAFPYLNENTSQMTQDQTMGGPNGKMGYIIPPDFNCGSNCVLQSYWVTMNKCNPIGSAEYFKGLYDRGLLKSWHMCPGDGITRGGYSPLYHPCGASLDLFPEEFWNCADVSMSGKSFNTHNYSQYYVPGNNGAGANNLPAIKHDASASPTASAPAISASPSAVVTSAAPIVTSAGSSDTKSTEGPASSADPTHAASSGDSTAPSFVGNNGNTDDDADQDANNDCNDPDSPGYSDSDNQNNPSTAAPSAKTTPATVPYNASPNTQSSSSKTSSGTSPGYSRADHSSTVSPTEIQTYPQSTSASSSSSKGPSAPSSSYYNADSPSTNSPTTSQVYSAVYYSEGGNTSTTNNPATTPPQQVQTITYSSDTPLTTDAVTTSDPHVYFTHPETNCTTMSPTTASHPGASETNGSYYSIEITAQTTAPATTSKQPIY